MPKNTLQRARFDRGATVMGDNHPAWLVFVDKNHVRTAATSFLPSVSVTRSQQFY
jgi:hypothetical protein